MYQFINESWEIIQAEFLEESLVTTRDPGSTASHLLWGVARSPSGGADLRGEACRRSGWRLGLGFAVVCLLTRRRGVVVAVGGVIGWCKALGPQCVDLLGGEAYVGCPGACSGEGFIGERDNGEQLR